MSSTKLVTIALSSLVAFSACHSKADSTTTGASAPATAAAPTAVAKIVSVSDVARLNTTKSAVVLDANGPDTRKEFGVVPGAVLLSSHDKYALSELPPSKSQKLVFYCGGLACRASDAAAARAANAGYIDVNIMREGIKGWRAAGQTTTPES